MKFICDLFVNSLEYAGLSGAKIRPKKCQISVIKCGPNELTLVVQSADNKIGTRFKLTGNISQTFEKFIPEGKCTIRLKNPNADLIFSKCDVMQLKLLLRTIKTGEIIMNGAAAVDQNAAKKLDKSGKRLLESLPSNQKKLKLSNFNEKCRTKLAILTRKDLTTTSFSQTLVELKLADLELSTVPPSISKLTKLQVLDLSGNKLTDLPKNMTAKLAELNLNGNLLGHSSSKSWKLLSLPNVKNSLQTLNLGNNNIPALPLEVLNLERLASLNIAQNNIKKFPSSFGELQRLRELDVSYNKIKAIDISFQMLKLASIDITNAFAPTIDDNSGFVIDGVPTLKRMVSAFIRNKRISHRTLPQTVQEDLLLMRRCKCMKVVGSTKEHYVTYSIKNITQTCISDGNHYVRMHYSICNGCDKLKNKQKRPSQ